MFVQSSRLAKTDEGTQKSDLSTDWPFLIQDVKKHHREIQKYLNSPKQRSANPRPSKSLTEVGVPPALNTAFFQVRPKLSSAVKMLRAQVLLGVQNCEKKHASV